MFHVQFRRSQVEAHESPAHGTGHPQVHIKVDDIEADVDVELAPLITEMWKAGIDTMMSCQQHDTPELEKYGNPTSWVWLDFATAEDAETFLTRVAGDYDPDPESMFQRIAGEPDKGSKRDWWYECHAMDSRDEKDPGGGCVMFDVSVRFPRDELPEVFQRMKAHNEWLELMRREMAARPRRTRQAKEPNPEAAIMRRMSELVSSGRWDEAKALGDQHGIPLTETPEHPFQGQCDYWPEHTLPDFGQAGVDLPGVAEVRAKLGAGDDDTIYTHWSYFDNRIKPRICAAELECRELISRVLDVKEDLGNEDADEPYLLLSVGIIPDDDIVKQHNVVERVVKKFGGRYDGGEFGLSSVKNFGTSWV
jgi:hypothetical protein